MTRRIAPGAQEAIATAKFIRISPTKARQVVDLIRGRHVEDARRVLQYTQRGACAPVRKVLESAIANAEHNRELPADELIVARAWVDEGPTLRRFRPRALGRATRIRKRTCHVSVVVGRMSEMLAQQGDTYSGRKSSERRGSGAKQEEQGKRPLDQGDEAAKPEDASLTDSPAEGPRAKSTAKTTATKSTAKTTATKSTAKTTATKSTAKTTAAKKSTGKPAAGKTTDRKSSEDVETRKEES